MGFSVALLLHFTGHRPHPFLIDDNATQWHSIAEYAFAELFSGHFPTWAPYQWAGFRIDEVGYYGLYNPIMLLCYLVQETGLSDLMSLYVFVMYGLGLLGAHALCAAAGLNRGLRLLMPIAYGCSAGYLLHSIWYYVYSVFGVGPWLLAILYNALTAHDKRARFAYSAAQGGLVALLFYLGNVQLASYTACAQFGVHGAFVLLSRCRRAVALGFVISSAVCAVALLPLMRMYGGAAAGALFDGAPQMFSVPPLPVVLSAFCPTHWMLALWPQVSRFCLYSNAGGGALAVLALLYGIKGKGRVGDPTHRALLLSCLATAAAIVWMASGPSVLQHLPVLSRFRMAFKWLFVLPPIVLAAAVVAARGQPRHLQQLGACVAALCIGISWQHAEVDSWGYVPTPQAMALLHERPATTPQQRVVFASWRGTGAEARIFTGHDRLRTDLYLANAGTSRRTPTLAGYNLSLPRPYPADMQALMGDDWYLGAGILLDHLQQQMPAVLALLQHYAVGSLMVEPRDLKHLPAAWRQQAVSTAAADVAVVPVPNAPALVTNSLGVAKKFVLQADGLKVCDVAAADGAITARWWPLPGFKAFAAGAEGRVPVPLSQGTLLQAQVPEGFSGTLHFQLHDSWSVGCFIVPYLLLVALCCLLRPSPARHWPVSDSAPA